ncbi:MAG: TonB-dependent receptor [Deltaproteobacteria bacterium]|nr:TonB-dependent receptor [Deltaproteobacteria bacterium]
MQEETSWHYDLGIFHRPMKNMDTKLVFYYIDIDNYIVGNSGDVFHNASSYGFNIDSMAFYGTEVEFNASLFDNLTLFGNYTYRKSDYDRSKLIAEAILLKITPEHKANLGLRYSLFNNTLITSDIRYIGERKSEGNVMNLDSFITVDVGLQHSYTKNIVLRVYATNILDKKYQEVYGFPLPGVGCGVNLKLVF